MAGHLQPTDKFWMQGSWGLSILGLLCAIFRLGFMGAIISATPEAGGKISEQASSYIGWCMRLCMEQYRRGVKSIIRTITRSITILRTWKQSPSGSIGVRTNPGVGIIANAEFVAKSSQATKSSLASAAQSARESTTRGLSGNEGKEPAYSLTIDTDECYFVKGDEGGYLVSNSSHGSDSFGLMCVVFEGGEKDKGQQKPISRPRNWRTG